MESTTTDELVHRLSTIPEEMGAGACFGTPVERDGHTLIPVARLSFGYGLGFGRGTGSKSAPSGNGAVGGEGGEGEGGGGGGGGSSTPVAIIDMTPSEVRIEPIIDQTRISVAGITLAGWMAFWLFWTIRALARQAAQTRRLEIQKGAAHQA
jgi:uncharacterized spore protein YtfJ